MTPDNDAMRALEDLSPFLNAKKPPFQDAAKMLWVHAETIRKALQRSAQVDVLVKALEIISLRSGSYGADIIASNALQQFNAKE